MELPERYDPHAEEKRWQDFWEKEHVYSFDKKSSKPIYSVDTPPPTVSGKMHIGHSFSYSQQDFIVRYKRMAGFNVFYPFGIDNNGVPTERLVEKMKGVKARDMSREAFQKLCMDTLEKELLPVYLGNWKGIGMSCETGYFYTTINPSTIKISQKSFIDIYKMGREYRKDAPAMWCPECETGISQQECQDKQVDSFFNDIVFKVEGKELIIATTRPELLPACVAIFYHPDDKRYQHLKGKKAEVPLFGFEVPILSDARVDVEKGTGIVMCCTFGDQTDMEWQKAYNLPIKIAITTNGRMSEIAGKYRSLPIKDARKEIIEELKKSGLFKSQKPINHAVNTHERCGTEVEFIKSKQWFIKYLDLKDEMIKWGDKLNWYPEHMKSRYTNWISGLQWDWLISRQRYFGVPFPVWYCKKCDEIILADESQLPVDPLKTKPKIAKCPKCGCAEFIPESDVLDTWATSSLTPEIAASLIPEMYDKLYPMSLRPQAHDIITFWLFNTVVKSQLHNKKNPWKDCVISGWALDPHGKKMSKSKGNVIEPQVMIDKYSADALRFWAAGSKLGEDLPFQEKDLVTGQKTVTKLWNASKFAIMHLADFDGKKPKLEAMDRYFISKLQELIKTGTEAFDVYEYSKTKAETEKFFWHMFCDYYLEIVKDRLYNSAGRGEEARRSAQFGLYTLLYAQLRLFAPFMPHITEEVYQLFFKEREKHKSIHISEWPKFEEKLVEQKLIEGGDVALEIIAEARKFKTDLKLSLAAPLKELVIEAKHKDKLREFLDDIKSSTKAEKVSFGEKLEIKN